MRQIIVITGMLSLAMSIYANSSVIYNALPGGTITMLKATFGYAGKTCDATNIINVRTDSTLCADPAPVKVSYLNNLLDYLNLD